MSFQLPAIRKLSQDARQRLMYIPTSLPLEQANSFGFSGKDPSI